MIAREDRDRYEDRARRPPGSEVPRKIYGRIVDGGDMPISTDDGQVVYLLERVDVDFSEESEADATIAGSGARFTAVRVGGKGPKAPAVGDVVICRPIGDRLGFTWAGGAAKIRLWVLSRATPSGFQGSPQLWTTDVFDPDAGDGSRFDVFAFWRYDVDTGADIIASTDFAPASIPTKQHIIHSSMADVTPSRIDHPWGYLEIPADVGGVHANNRNPSGSIVVRVIDTEGDPEWEAVALLPVVSYYTDATGKHPDVMAVVTWALADKEMAVRDQLTWYCPGYSARPATPGTINPASDHSFAEAAVTVTYHNILGLPFFPAHPSKDTAKDDTPDSPMGYWQYRRPAIDGGLIDAETRLDSVTNASAVTLESGFGASTIGRPGRYIGNHYYVDSPAYTPTDVDVTPSVFSGVLSSMVTLCKQSYGYVSVPVGASPPFSAPGCIPPAIKIKIEATGIWDGRTAINPGFGAISPSPTTKDLTPFFGPATGTTSTLTVRSASLFAGTTVYSYSDGFLNIGTFGPATFPPGNPSLSGRNGMVMVLPTCTGSRPTTGPLYTYFAYVSFGTILNFRYLIGEWSY